MKPESLTHPTNQPYAQNRWMGIKQNQIPCSLVLDGTLSLKTDALAVYMALLHIHRGKMLGLKLDKRHDEFHARVTVGQARLMQMTGFSINKITNAVKQLREAGFVAFSPRRKRSNDRKPRRKEEGGSKTYEYYLLNPNKLDGEPLIPGGQINIIPTNRIPYFTYPACIITMTKEKWSLANMTSSEIRTYLSILWLANKRRGNSPKTTVAELRGLSGLSQKTVIKALQGLECNRRLIRLWPYFNHPGDSHASGSKRYQVELCDPLTGDPIPQSGDPQDHPANYRLKGLTKRPNLNTLDPEQVEELIYAANRNRGEEATPYGSEGELKMRCPFHSDDRPSLSASTTKNGCWRCFGCNHKGSLSELLAGLNGATIGESIQAIAATAGHDIEYQEPDGNFTIYRYRSAAGSLLKEVLRGADKNGGKTFRQRRPGPNGMVWDIQGLGPMLYNLDLLQWPSTICITEGEKDADTITGLHLKSGHREVIGTTSGGADSWHPSLARQLKDKRVIVMPDDDPAGERYASAVKASLDAEGIENTVVSFAGTGHKDVTEYMAEHTIEDLVRLIGNDWIEMPRSFSEPHTASIASSIPDLGIII